MKIIQLISAAWQKMRYRYGHVMAGILLLRMGAFAYADDSSGIIPVSKIDKGSSGGDFASTMITILQKDIIPVIEIAGAMWILWTAISTMARGVKEAQEKQTFDPLKNAIIKSVLVVVVGGALLYLLDQVRSNSSLAPTPG